MKKLFLVMISLWAAGLAGITAKAADVAPAAPLYKAPLVSPAYNWSGLYVGGVVGYGWGESLHCDSDIPCSVDFVRLDFKSANAGVTLGYNWQWANWVLGIEGDWSWANMKGSALNGVNFECGAGGGLCETKIESFGTIRGRVGYAFDRFLPYVTAGVAFTELEAGLLVGTPFVLSDSTTESSFTIGGGIEYGFSPNWSAKLEYLYVSKLDDFDYDNLSLCGADPGCFVSDVDYSVVRLGVNYRFGGF